MDSSARLRVKVYRLGTGNEWLDQGTGHCSCEYNPEKSEGVLTVHSEDEDDSILLSYKIRAGEDVYHRQQETLIVWSEPEGVDLALSFQEVEGCAEIWEKINDLQQHYAEDLFSDPSDVNGTGSADFITLPDPTMANLSEIASVIKAAQSEGTEKEKLSAFIIIDNYIDKLMPVHESCEDLESLTDLHLLHDIMTGIILLDDIAIVQYIIRDEVILGCLGMLEYDPELGTEKRDYREFLTKRSKFKQIVPINDPEAEQKIHHAFRLQYLRDTVLPRVMDEGLSAILGSMIFYHNFEIVSYIGQDDAFTKELFGILENDSEPVERKQDVILFVQQFCAMAKTIQLPIRLNVYRNLSQNGLFNVFEPALADSNPRIKMAGAEVLLSTLEHDPSFVRSFIVKQSEHKEMKQLLDVIMDMFLLEEDLGLKLHFSEVIRLLLDTTSSPPENGMLVPVDSIPNVDHDSDKFLELFYATHVAKFVSPLLDLTEGQISFDRTLSTLCEIICHIMSFMVKSHSFRSKYYVLSSGIVAKVCLLFKNRDQHLRLCALRFFRTCIGIQDEFYHRYLMKHNVMQHIVDLFLSTHNKNNLLNSACIEFFDFIRGENIKSLITHVVSLHGEKLRSIEYVNTFKDLQLKFDQKHDTSVSDAEARESFLRDNGLVKRGPGMAQAGEAWSSSTMDDDEEAYFNNSDDEDEVPYEDSSADPPVSDLRKRVRETSDDEEDTTTNPSLESSNDQASATEASEKGSVSLKQPAPAFRKLVDYGDDEDDDEDLGVFGQRSISVKPTTPSPPPTPKRIRLNSEAKTLEGDAGAAALTTLTGNASPAGSSEASASAGSPSKGVEGKGPIKFKLNSLRNGRSASPLSSASGSRSRSVSPLPPPSPLPAVATRTEIAFVRAKSEEGGRSLKGEEVLEGKQSVEDGAHGPLVDITGPSGHPKDQSGHFSNGTTTAAAHEADEGPTEPLHPSEKVSTPAAQVQEGHSS